MNRETKKKSRKVEETDGYGTLRFLTCESPGYNPPGEGLVWLEITQDISWESDGSNIDRVMYSVDPTEIRAALDDLGV